MISSISTRSNETQGLQGFVSFYTEEDRAEVFGALVEILHINKVGLKSSFLYESLLPKVDEKDEDKDTMVYDICFTFETPKDMKLFYRLTQSFRDDLCTE